MNCYYETMDEEHLPLIMGYKRTKARNRRFYINMSYKHLCEAYLETMNDCKYEMSDFIKNHRKTLFRIAPFCNEVCEFLVDRKRMGGGIMETINNSQPIEFARKMPSLRRLLHKGGFHMIRVVLQCSETYFVEAFSNYVSAKCKDMEFLCFTDVQKTLDYIRKGRLRVDIIAAEDELLRALPETKAFCMEIGERTAFSDEMEATLNIYQPVGAILADLRAAAALRSGRSGTEGQASVVAFYSNEGGSGKTTASYAAALAAVRAGKQAIYLNIEMSPCVQQLYAHNFEHPLDDLLYAIRDGRNIAQAILDVQERNQDGVLVLPPCHSVGNVLALTQAEIKNFFAELTTKTGIDYVFVDMTCGYLPLNLWVLEECTTLVQVYSDTTMGRARLHNAAEDEYFQNLPIGGKTLTVLNRSRSKNEENADVLLPFSESLQAGRMVQDVQNRNPAYLAACTALVDKIV